MCALAKRSKTAIINHIYELRKLDPKIDYYSVNGLSRSQIVQSGMKKFRSKLIQDIRNPKKEYRFSIVSRSYTRKKAEEYKFKNKATN